jgi:L,D-peptidoglycan transpeptidase YkuD (ErfK/YbiS/YcfS/YnhG family)
MHCSVSPTLRSRELYRPGSNRCPRFAVYDLLVVIRYNTAPVLAGAGSTIFLHVARPDFAVAAPVVAALMRRLGPASKITIRV